MKIDLKMLSNNQLLAIILEHNCTRSSMDGCDCDLIERELDFRYYAGDISGDMWKPIKERESKPY